MRHEVTLEERHHALLHLAVEIDHDVAAEDHIEAFVQIGELEEVELPVLDQPADMRRDPGRPRPRE